MPYQYQIEVRTGYIRALVQGVRGTYSAGENVLPVWEEIARNSKDTGLSKVLYISHVTGQIPVMEAYDVIEEFVRRHWDGLVIAYVDQGGTAIADLKMLKAICLQHNITFGLCSSEQEAEAWLAAL